MSYIKRKSKKQEDRTAKEFGGKVQVASGALWGAKADVRTGDIRTSSFNETDFLIENKFTDKGSYKLERKIWEKIYSEALSDNFRIGAMQIDIQDLRLFVIDTNDFKAIFEGYDFKVINSKTKNKSFLLKREEMLKLSNDTVAELNFLGQCGYRNQIKLIIMNMDLFLEAGI